MAVVLAVEQEECRSLIITLSMMTMRPAFAWVHCKDTDGREWDHNLD